MTKIGVLTFTLRFVAIVQFVLGAVFLFFPARAAAWAGLSAAPPWTAWLFGMMAARFLGFGYGMLLSARAPLQHRSWIVAMVGVQTIDWIVTLYYLSVHAVSLAQVTTAAFFPALFVLLIAWTYPRASAVS